MNQLNQLLKNASPRPWEVNICPTNVLLESNECSDAATNARPIILTKELEFYDAQLITLAVNNFEEMIEVLKLAKKGLDDPDDDYFSAVELEDRLNTILSKLNAEE